MAGVFKVHQRNPRRGAFLLLYGVPPHGHGEDNVSGLCEDFTLSLYPCNSYAHLITYFQFG